jgi:hypothetical protein
MTNDARFEILMVMKIQVEVFWAVTPCNAAAGYQCSGGLCCLQLHPEDKGTGILLQHYTEPLTSRPQLESKTIN